MMEQHERNEMSEQEFNWTCETCAYWARTGAVGECRRRSPKNLNAYKEGVWPVTEPSDYCGEGRKITKGTK